MNDTGVEGGAGILSLFLKVRPESTGLFISIPSATEKQNCVKLGGSHVKYCYSMVTSDMKNFFLQKN